EPVLRIGRVVLPLRAGGGIARRLTIARERRAHVVLLVGLLSIRHDRGLNRARLHDAQDGSGDCAIHARAAETDTPRLALVEPSAMAGVPCDVVMLPSVMHRELGRASSTAQESGDQGLSLARCADRSGGPREVAADRALDTLEALPLDVALVR